MLYTYHIYLYIIRILEIYIYLEPETSTLKWLFQLDDFKSLHEKWLFHQTSIKKLLFGVPGIYIYICVSHPYEPLVYLSFANCRLLPSAASPHAELVVSSSISGNRIHAGFFLGGVKLH